MNTIGEATSSSLRRLQTISRIMNSNSQLPPFCIKRKSYTSESSASSKNETKKFVKIGNCVIEIKPIKAPEKVPRGYLYKCS